MELKKMEFSFVTESNTFIIYSLTNYTPSNF